MSDQVEAYLDVDRESGTMHENRRACAIGTMRSLSTGTDLSTGAETEPFSVEEIAKLCSTALREEVRAGNQYKFYEDYIPDDLKGKIDPKILAKRMHESSLANAFETEVTANDGEVYNFPIQPSTAYDSAYVATKDTPELLSPQAAKAIDALATEGAKLCFNNNLPLINGEPAIVLCNLAGQKQAEIDSRDVGFNDITQPNVKRADITGPDATNKGTPRE